MSLVRIPYFLGVQILLLISDQFALVAQMVKSLPVLQEICVQFLGWGYLWRREWLPTPVFLPGEFHGQRSLAGYSP